MSKKVENAIAISNAHISFVSLVDKAANLHTFLVTKQENNKASFQTTGSIVKSSDEDGKHYLTGIVYEPMVADAHDNYMTADEIQKACHWFSKNGNKVDIQHCFVKKEGLEVVENYIAPCDMEIGGVAIKKGTWLMTVECTDDEVWKSVENGDITGFSMGGIGDYADEDVDISKSEPKGEPTEKLSLFKKLAKSLGFKINVEKGEVYDRFAERAINDCFWDAFYALLHTLFDWSDSVVKSPDEIQDCLTEFNTIVSRLLIDGKIGELEAPDITLMKSEGFNLMTDKEIQDLIEKSATTAVEKANEKPAETPAANNEPSAEEPVEKTYSQAEVDKLIKDTVEKTATATAEKYNAVYGISKQIDGEDSKPSVKKSVFAGLL